jgi:hypothetical protein
MYESEKMFLRFEVWVLIVVNVSTMPSALFASLCMTKDVANTFLSVSEFMVEAFLMTKISCINKVGLVKLLI